jgi:phage shock protein A
MPRKDSSVFENVRQQAIAALNRLRKDIRTAESDLNDLRKQEQQLAAITGEARTAAAVRNGASALSRGSGRTNWRAVLDKLPKRFTASDVRSVRGVGDKRSGEIFAAITRWIDSGLVKRKERGVYERAA